MFLYTLFTTHTHKKKVFTVSVSELRRPRNNVRTAHSTGHRSVTQSTTPPICHRHCCTMITVSWGRNVPCNLIHSWSALAGTARSGSMLHRLPQAALQLNFMHAHQKSCTSVYKDTSIPTHPISTHTHTHTFSLPPPPPPPPPPTCKGHHAVWCSQRKENLETQPPIHVLTECKKKTIGNTHTYQTVHTDTVRKEETNHQFPLSTELKHTQQILTKHCTLYSKVCTESLERNITCYAQVSTSSSPFISLTSRTKNTHTRRQQLSPP